MLCNCGHRDVEAETMLCRPNNELTLFVSLVSVYFDLIYICLGCIIIYLASCYLFILFAYKSYRLRSCLFGLGFIENALVPA